MATTDDDLGNRAEDTAKRRRSAFVQAAEDATAQNQRARGIALVDPAQLAAQNGVTGADQFQGQPGPNSPRRLIYDTAYGPNAPQNQPAPTPDAAPSQPTRVLEDSAAYARFRKAELAQGPYPTPQAEAPAPDPAESAPGPGQNVPSPAPASVVQNAGVLPPAPEPAPAPLKAEPPEDPWGHQPKVDAMIKKALSMGRTDIAETIQKEYSGLVSARGQWMEDAYKQELMPKVAAMQKTLQEYEGKQLPQKLAIQANELHAQAMESMQKMTAHMWMAYKNPVTRQAGLDLFNNSGLIYPGEKIATVERLASDPRFIVGKDEQGNVVHSKSGQPFIIEQSNLDALAQRYFANPKALHVVKPGEKLVDGNTGATVATGDAKPQPEHILENLKVMNGILAKEFGVDQGLNGMIDPGVIKDRPNWTKALAEGEALVRQGVPPNEAARTISEKYQLGVAARGKSGKPADTTGDLPKFW